MSERQMKPCNETGAEMVARWKREDAARNPENRRFYVDWKEMADQRKKPPPDTQNLSNDGDPAEN